MKNRKIKNMLRSSMLLLVCLGLTGCAAGTASKQEKAGDAEEAAVNFLTDMQSGSYEAAMAYMEEGNELLHVLPAAAGESVPEMDEVYRRFCEQMKEMTFSISDEKVELPDTVNVTIRNRDYGGAIRTAMAEALQLQSEQGGDSFADFTSWMGQAVENAPVGEEDTQHITMTKRKDGYYIQHSGYPDQTFLNLLTGGFYEYMDLTMTTCTMEEDGVKYTYYIAAAGDEVISYLVETAEPFDTASLTDEDIAEMKAYYEETAAAQEGVYMGCQIGDGEIVTATGIDFYEASQTAMINAGIVSGKYSGNTTSSYISLNATIQGFESDGMTCETVPQYDTEE